LTPGRIARVRRSNCQALLDQRLNEDLGIDLGGAHDWIVETGEIVLREPR